MAFDLELHNRKLRKFIAKDAKSAMDSARTIETESNSLEELKMTEINESYILTEVETTRAAISPNTSALNTSTGFASTRGGRRKKAMIKSAQLLAKEKFYREEYKD